MVKGNSGKDNPVVTGSAESQQLEEIHGKVGTEEESAKDAGIPAQSIVRDLNNAYKVLGPASVESLAT